MDAAAKTQIVERVKQASNILVTVSTNPSVDQLAACIGLTLLLNRMGKHATAVFSGQVPSTLEFLQPEKTIETNTDSLRDFIISLDKNKADKLRYKVEDEVVKIFITPYKTSLSEKDLVFSQGDYNVEVVIALGIQQKAQIDAAITAHGRILHDATIISLNAGQGKAPDIGQINWQDTAASSLCEMIVSISEAFGPGLIDNQMATAFLTGIVAETQRFSNPRTSPKVMTMSAQLMAAGANQQLIVSKLEPPVPPVQKYQPPAKGQAPSTPLATAPAAQPTLGAMTIPHEESKAAPSPAPTPAQPEEIHIDAQGNLITAAEASKPAEPVATPPPPAPPPSPPLPPKPPEEPLPGPHSLLKPDTQPPALESVFTATAQPEWDDPYNTIPIDPLSGEKAKPELLERKNQAKSESMATNAPDVDSARSAVENAIASAPFDPSFSPPVEALNATPIDLGKQSDQKDEAAPPPPFPPPLTPVKGVVIPTPAGNTKTK